jgi:prepilin peptidase CpaA
MTGIDTITILKLTMAAAASTAVIVEDIQHRRISNRLCAVLLLTGAFSAGFCHGWNGLADGLLGASLAFLVFLIPYGLGGLGGGDVKLMAGFGALIGIGGVLPALLLVAVAGALTAVGCLVWTHFCGRAVPVAIPYAPAIVAGSLLVAFSQIGAK